MDEKLIIEYRKANLDNIRASDMSVEFRTKVKVLFNGADITMVCHRVNEKEGWAEFYLRDRNGEVIQSSREHGLAPICTKAYGDVRAWKMIDLYTRTDTDESETAI
jgi:hypothetical protein